MSGERRPEGAQKARGSVVKFGEEQRVMHRLLAAIAVSILPALLGSPAIGASLPLIGGPGGGAD